MCRARDQSKIKWELFILFLAVWNLFYVPYNFAFSSDLGNSTATDVLNFIVDIIFMVDVAINFRTTIINEKTGEEIFDGKRIAIKYLKGKFFIDLLASIPFDFLSVLIGAEMSNNTFTFQLFGLLKLIRIVRLTKLITYLNLKDDVKMSLKLGKLIFFLIMYIHCVG